MTGEAVVIVQSAGREREAIEALTAAGARSIDTASVSDAPAIPRSDREAKREVKNGEHLAAAYDEKDEERYRRGFDAALKLAARGKSDVEIEDLLQQEFTELCERHFFVRGYKNALATWKANHEALRGIA
jgi:hypothetical protein